MPLSLSAHHLKWIHYAGVLYYSLCLVSALFRFFMYLQAYTISYLAVENHCRTYWLSSCPVELASQMVRIHYHLQVVHFTYVNKYSIVVVELDVNVYNGSCLLFRNVGQKDLRPEMAACA